MCNAPKDGFLTVGEIAAGPPPTLDFQAAVFWIVDGTLLEIALVQNSIRLPPGLPGLIASPREEVPGAFARIQRPPAGLSSTGSSIRGNGAAAGLHGSKTPPGLMAASPAILTAPAETALGSHPTKARRFGSPWKRLVLADKGGILPSHYRAVPRSRGGRKSAPKPRHSERRGRCHTPPHPRENGLSNSNRHNVNKGWPCRHYGEPPFLGPDPFRQARHDHGTGFTEDSAGAGGRHCDQGWEAAQDRGEFIMVCCGCSSPRLAGENRLCLEQRLG